RSLKRFEQLTASEGVTHVYTFSGSRGLMRFLRSVSLALPASTARHLFDKHSKTSAITTTHTAGRTPLSECRKWKGMSLFKSGLGQGRYRSRRPECSNLVVCGCYESTMPARRRQTMLPRNWGSTSAYTD